MLPEERRAVCVVFLVIGFLLALFAVADQESYFKNFFIASEIGCYFGQDSEHLTPDNAQISRIHPLNPAACISLLVSR
jgi:hypothetical protein